MTSATAPRGKVTASGYYTGSTNIVYYPFWAWGTNGTKGNNGLYNLGWEQPASASTAWTQYEFPDIFDEMHITSISLNGDKNWPQYYWKTFKIQAMINGELKDVTDTITTTQDQWSQGFKVNLDVYNCSAIRFVGLSRSLNDPVCMQNTQLYGDVTLSDDKLMFSDFFNNGK